MKRCIILILIVLSSFWMVCCASSKVVAIEPDNDESLQVILDGRPVDDFVLLPYIIDGNIDEDNLVSNLTTITERYGSWKDYAIALENYLKNI